MLEEVTRRRDSDESDEEMSEEEESSISPVEVEVMFPEGGDIVLDKYFIIQIIFY